MFIDFLKQNLSRVDAEFYIPFALNEVVREGKAQVKVLHTHEKWFGVTYREDRDMVINSLKSLVDKGVYPSDLWSD